MIKNDDCSLSVELYGVILSEAYEDLWNKMISDGFVDSSNNFVNNPDNFLNVMTNLIYEAFLANGYYKVWDTTDPAAWTGIISVGADEFEDILDDVVAWKMTNGDFSNISEYPEYREMMVLFLFLLA